MKMTKEKIGLLLIGAALITNPLTGQYVQLAVELAFSQLYLVGAWVSLIAGAYACGLIAWYMYTSRDKVNVPKHGTKPAGKYILT
jgi:hypothetical protein